MTVTTYKWTIERFHQAIDAGVFDDEPLELLRGELIVMSPEREIRFYRSPYGISSNKSSKNLALSRLQVLIP
ncbi:MAG TPA: hypothetical protein VK184_26450 [Nostocaceae cyanobacterium]|nr:hypothetical protein [Nostocaceae cyanobacterium]